MTNISEQRNKEIIVEETNKLMSETVEDASKQVVNVVSLASKSGFCGFKKRRVIVAR